MEIATVVVTVETGAMVEIEVMGITTIAGTNHKVDMDKEQEATANRDLTLVVAVVQMMREQCLWVILVLT